MQLSVLVRKYAHSPRFFQPALAMGILSISLLVGTAAAQPQAPMNQEKSSRLESQQVDAQAQDEQNRNGANDRAEPAIFNMGSEVDLEPFAYKVTDAEWRLDSEAQKLGGMLLKESLVVDLELENRSDTKQEVPSFVLVDKEGMAYEAVAPILNTPEGPIVLSELLPGGPIHATLYFNVPKGRSYRLQVTGSDWSTQSTLIPLETSPDS